MSRRCMSSSQPSNCLPFSLVLLLLFHIYIYMHAQQSSSPNVYRYLNRNDISGVMVFFFSFCLCLSVKRTINDVDDKANGKPSAGVATLERNSVLPIRLWASTRHSHSQRKKWRLLRTRAGWSLGDTSRSAKKKEKGHKQRDK